MALNNLKKTSDSDLIANFTKGVLSSDTTVLGKAITLIESEKKEHQKLATALLEKCLTHRKDSIRIGITGVPGVGKSTFIEAFGKFLINEGKKVAVLTVDPSSVKTKGSILGDKTRMTELTKEPNAFVRPSPSGGSLGGVARKTQETIVLLEAAGFNVIIIETVGIGQSETAVRDMIDFFLLLKLPGAGDELQGIKRGVMEMADAVAINKADGPNIKSAELAKSAFQNAIHLLAPKTNGWMPKVMVCSAIESTGLEPIWNCIEAFEDQMKNSGHFNQFRKSQNKTWLRQHLNYSILKEFYDDPKISEQLLRLEEQVLLEEITPYLAAEKLLATYRIKE